MRLLTIPHGAPGRRQGFLLGVLLLVSPLLSLTERISGRELQSFPVIGMVSVIALLVLRNLALGVRESDRLRNEVRAQNVRLAHFAAIVESSGDSITSATLDGTITSWNPASERLYGYSAEEMTGRRIHRIIEPDRHAEVDATFASIAEGAAIAPHETTGVRADGTIVPVALTVSTVRDAHGAIIGASTIARDISDSRAAAAEREALLSELAAQNDRLRVLDGMKDDFIASVSHELRTPLTSIRGYLDLVREDGTLTPDQDRMLGIVDRNADRLLGLVTDLLLVAQIEAGQLTLNREAVPLGELADEAVDAARPRAQSAKVALQIAVDPDVVVDGDRMRLAQVVDNLISNAIKFTPAGGRVEVHVERRDDLACITVSDTGAGIPEAERMRLFERFFRTAAATRSAVQGTGLGLAIVKAIVESHGGSVRAEARAVCGSTFVVTLPATVPALRAGGLAVASAENKSPA